MSETRPRPWGTWIMWLKGRESANPAIVTLHPEGTANSTPAALFGGFLRGPCISPLHDVWEWSGERSIVTACLAFLFSPSGGAPIGWLRVRGAFDLSAEADEMGGKCYVDLLACTADGGWPDPLAPDAPWQVSPNTPAEGLEARFVRWRLGPAGPLVPGTPARQPSAVEAM